MIFVIHVETQFRKGLATYREVYAYLHNARQLGIEVVLEETSPPDQATNQLVDETVW